MVENIRPETGLLRVKEANGFGFFHTLRDHFAGRIIPERLLGHRTEALIIARLRTLHQRLARAGIAWKKRGVEPLIFHRFLLPRRLARMPNAPAAPKSSGAKIGGPYRML